MAYAYLDDGAPEAEEYESNYYYFDASNPEAVAAIEKMLTSTSPRNAAFRAEFSELCRASFDRPVAKRPKRLPYAWVTGVVGLVTGFLALNL